jgi:hypothetical protein
MAVADGALSGYQSLENIRKQEFPAGKDEVILRFHDLALGWLILRKCTKANGVTEDPMPKSSFTDIFKSILTNTGYFYGVSIHAIRRQLGKGVNSKFVLLVGMRFIQKPENSGTSTRSSRAADSIIRVSSANLTS